MKLSIASVFAAVPLFSGVSAQCPPNPKDRTSAGELKPISTDGVVNESDVDINQGSYAVIGYQTLYNCDRPNENNKSGSLVVRKTGQRSGSQFYDDGPGWPALTVVNYMNRAEEVALRAFGRKSYGASIGSGEGDCDIDSGVASPRPSLFVCKGGSGGGKFNTNNSKNPLGGAIKRTAIEARGAIRVCGKSAKNEEECTNSWSLYAADGVTGVIAKVDGEDINITGELMDLKGRVEGLEGTRRMLRASGEEQIEDKDLQVQVNELKTVVEAQQAQLELLQSQIGSLVALIEEIGIGEEPLEI